MSTVIKLKRSETSSSVPTTSDLEVGEVAVNTVDQKIYMRSSTGVVEIANTSSGGAGGSGNSFTNISVLGQSTVQADSATDTLTLVGTGLNSITTDASTDTITIGTPTGISFVKADGTSTSLNLRVEAGTLSSAVNSLYIPFTKEDGSSVNTLVMN
tara:strand:+ start:1695 stop:2162 length:468 start_codon:yes stop_codon:yes gene_type:complete